MTTTLNASTAGAGGFIATGDNSGSLALQTAGTTAVTIDTSQNVGIGNTPSSWNTYKVTQIGGGTADVSIASNNDDTNISTNAYYNTGWKYQSSSTLAERYQQGAGTHRWYYAPSGTAGNAITWSEAMRIDSSGNVIIGATSAILGTSPLQTKSTVAGNQVWTCWNSATSGTRYYAYFGVGTSFTNTGAITSDGSTTSYVTTSDYRLKENIAPMTGALAKVTQLKPVTYTWKSTGKNGEGFIAHELQAVVPDAVTGEKDALDENGGIKPQGIDTSFLVATLTAAIQELKAINDTQAETINALTARVVALESRGTV